MCDLNNRYLLLTVLEAEKSKTQALIDPVSSEALLPGLELIGPHPHDLISSQSPHLLIPSHWGLELQYPNFEETQTYSPYQPYCLLSI